MILEWDGKGLPPVGAFCEYQPIGSGEPWRRVEILLHIDAGMAMAAVFLKPGERVVKQAIADCFRPIRMNEQVDAEHRDYGCERMLEIIRESPWGMTASPYECVAMLYDAGYRKFEITDDSDPA